MVNCPNVSCKEQLADLQWQESIALQESIEANREACDVLSRYLRKEPGVCAIDVQMAQIGARLAGRRWKAIRNAKRLMEAA